jgi:hypothetical protein
VNADKDPDTTLKMNADPADPDPGNKVRYETIFQRQLKCYHLPVMKIKAHLPIFMPITAGTLLFKLFMPK